MPRVTRANRSDLLWFLLAVYWVRCVTKAEITEDALLRAMRTATAVNDAIHELAAAVPKADAPVSEDAPLPMLPRQPDGIAKLMMASNAGISVTIAGVRQLPAMRAEAAAEIPGTQTVYPPDEDDPPDEEYWPAILEGCEELGKLRRQAEAARAEGDMVALAQALHRFDEIREADKARPRRNGDFLRSSIEAIDDELRAIMAGKYDKA